MGDEDLRGRGVGGVYAGVRHDSVPDHKHQKKKSLSKRHADNEVGPNTPGEAHCPMLPFRLFSRAIRQPKSQLARRLKTPCFPSVTSIGILVPRAASLSAAIPKAVAARSSCAKISLTLRFTDSSTTEG